MNGKLILDILFYISGGLITCAFFLWCFGCLDYFRTLIEEQKGKLSLGRISFWAAFICAVRSFWISGDVSYPAVSLVLGLAAYGMGKKYIRSKYYKNELDITNGAPSEDEQYGD